MQDNSRPSKHYERTLFKERRGWKHLMDEEDLFQALDASYMIIQTWIEKGLPYTETTRGRIFNRNDLIEFFKREAHKKDSHILSRNLKKVLPHTYRKVIKSRNYMLRRLHRERKRERAREEGLVDYESKRSTPSIIGWTFVDRVDRYQGIRKKHSTNKSSVPDQDN